MKTSKKILIIYMVTIVCAGATIGIYTYFNNAKTSETSIKSTQNTTPLPTITPNKMVTLPTSLVLKVPYAKQAPFSNWTVHEESCEEAALVMYKEFLEGNKLDIALEEGPLDTIYREMKNWQKSHYGKEADLTMNFLGSFSKEYFGYNFSVSAATETNIKEAIYNGSPVVVPVMTHSLQNSMYGRNSVYHVLLIKGYDETGVITNDAGVGNGQNHHYDWSILWQAIDAQTSHMNGQGRVMLTLSK